MVHRRGLLGFFIAAALAVSGGVPIAAAQPYAERITPGNLAVRRVHGPDAHGGIGDWAIGNGQLCAVVSDLSHESGLSPQGGVLIDVSHCGKADDHFVLLQPLMNFSREKILPIQSIRADTAPAEARIVTSGSRDGVRHETRYRVTEERPLEIQIVTTLERTSDGERAFLFGDVSIHGHRQLAPFSIVTGDLARSRGFAHPDIDVDDMLAMASAMGAADLQVLVGSDALEPGVAYGLQLRGATLERADGEITPLPHVALNGASFSLFGAFTRPLWLGDEDNPGLLGLAQTLLMDLREGDRIRYERALLLADRSDVASLTDRIWPAAALVRGRVDDASARLLVTAPDGSPRTHVRPNPDGRFAFRLPGGHYELKARAAGGRELVRRFEVPEEHARDAGAPAEHVELGVLQLGSPAWVRLPEGSAMRLVFEGKGDTPTPRFGDDHRDFRVGERPVPPSELTSSVSLAGVAGDPREVAVQPGNYLVYATRGPEYGVTRTSLTAVAGEVSVLRLAPPARILDTPGWASADLHVHSGLSDDSTLDPRVRLASFRAQGADVLVSTEHDRVADFAPLIREMGLAEEVQSIIGVEITTTVRSDITPNTTGHHNLFPVRLRADEYRGGAPMAEGRRLRTTIASARAGGPERVFQLNHPRPSSGLGDKSDLNFFTHLTTGGSPFDPTLPIDASVNRPLSEREPRTGLRDLDFDVLELMNGPRMERYYVTRADWFSLLLQGEYRPGTGNGDSHHLRELIALPRNYVRLDFDPSQGLDEAAFVRAVRTGALYGTTGPILDVRLGDAEIGQRFRGERGTLHLRVDAAHWIPISQARVYVNGALTHTLPIAAGESRDLVLSFETDSFVTVEVEGTPGEIYRAVAPGFTPFAFTNPIFVDADSDGSWSAPGLPTMRSELPPSITEPLASMASPER